MLEAIVAVYADWGIGARGTQPVTVKADRQRFAALTRGAAVIVGRRTLADFPGGKPLKGRQNIVLSRSIQEIPGAVVAGSPAQALAEAQNAPRVFVIGGGSVYRALMPDIGRVWVTKLDTQPVSDTFFPNLDADPAWILREEGEMLREGETGYCFCLYERLTHKRMSPGRCPGPG